MEMEIKIHTENHISQGSKLTQQSDLESDISVMLQVIDHIEALVPWLSTTNFFYKTHIKYRNYKMLYQRLKFMQI